MISLTRFLYIQDEVKLALLLSLLEKKEESIYWAYELYYSSNKSNEIFDFLWQIYYDFYAILNPSFESYFLSKQKQFLKKKKENENDNENDIIISMIVQDLMIRMFTTDAFLLKHFILSNLNGFKQTNIKKETIECWTKTFDYKNIAHYILAYENYNSYDLYSTFIEILDPSKKETLLKQWNKIVNHLFPRVNASFLLLVKILSLLQKPLPDKKTFYIQVKPEEIIKYNIDYKEKNPYLILTQACIYKINESKFFSLFTMQREQMSYSELTFEYNNNWLYYASFSPIWKTRLDTYNAKINDKYILFPEEDQEELFYNKYNYEPDEQSLELKSKTIPLLDISKEIDWNTFQNSFNKQGFLTWTKDELQNLPKIIL